MPKRLILTYHAIGQERTRIAVPAERFKRQLSWLRDHGCRSLTVSGLLTDTGSGVAVAITFDDGFASTYDIAFPLLSDLGFTGTTFPIVAALGRRIAWETDEGGLPGYRMMTTGQVLELASHDWEVGSHTLGHRCCVRRERPDLLWDLRMSRRILQDALGVPVAGLAYPNGCQDQDSASAVEAAGYSWACTTFPGDVGARPERYTLRRVNVGNSTSMTRFRAAFIEPVQSARRVSQERRNREHNPHVHGSEVETTVFV